MGFSYKTLNSTDITLTSYIANKQWEVNNSTLSQNGITIYIGENVPVNRDHPFDPIDDIETSNDEYRRLVFESIKHLYYENYTSGSLTGQFFKSSSYTNYEQTTLISGSMLSAFKNLPTVTGSSYDPSTLSPYDGTIYDISSSLYDESIFDPDRGGKIVVVSIDKEIYGSGLKPNSVSISGSGYYLRDDGEGNIFNFNNPANYARYNSAIYNQDIYLELLNSNFPQLEYVGNVFYSHGLIIITNSDYFCAFGTPPTAINDYFSYNNMFPTFALDVLSNDFSDCGTINYNSFLSTGGTFPDYTYANGFLNITPNQTSVIPGNYKLGYTISNSSGIRSNTGSINLIINSEPLQINNIISSSLCFGNSSIRPVTFSIDYGVPYYSYSLDNGLNYTGISNLFNITVSGSVTASNNNTIYVKDYLGEIISSSFSSWFPEVTYTTTILKNPCSISSNDGVVRFSAVGDQTGIAVKFNNEFVWNTLPMDYTGLGTGSYDVKIKDINNCVVSSSVTLSPYQQLVIDSFQSNVGCYGGSNGSLSLEISNVIDNLYVTLLDPTSSAIYNNVPLSSFINNFITASNLSTGSYTLNLTSTGSYECQSYSNTFTITSPSPLIFTATASYIDSCSNAMIFNATGGTPPYTYFAQNSSSFQLYSSDSSSVTLNGLNSGSYNLWVRDNSLCPSPIQTIEVYGRGYIYSGSNCEII